MACCYSPYLLGYENKISSINILTLVYKKEDNCFRILNGDNVDS